MTSVTLSGRERAYSRGNETTIGAARPQVRRGPNCKVMMSYLLYPFAIISVLVAGIVIVGIAG